MSVLDYIDSSVFTPAYKNTIPLVISYAIDKICRELFYVIRCNEPIFIYGDYDMDGFCAQKLWYEILHSLYNVPCVHFRYSSRMHCLDSSVVNQVEGSGCKVIIICDTGSSLEDQALESMLCLKGYTPIIIDHHKWEGNYEAATKSSFVFNSYEERSLFNGAEISGAYASLIIANRLCEVYFKRSLSYNAMVYALASMYSDVVDLATPIGRVLYNCVSTIRMPGPDFIKAMNVYNYSYSRRFFSFIVAPKINSCFRMERFLPLNNALTVTTKYGMSSVIDALQSVHTEASRIVSIAIPLFSRDRFGEILLCIHEETEATNMINIRNFSGLVANAIANQEKCAVVAVIKQGNVYSGSFRDFFNRSLLDFFVLFCNAGGHDSAFGLQFTNLKEFKRHLLKLSTYIKSSVREDYKVLSSNLLHDKDDVQVLALYNEYMNVRPRIKVSHQCRYLRTILCNRYRKEYDVGLPYNVISKLPLLEGNSILIEPTISRSVELRCVE